MNFGIRLRWEKRQKKNFFFEKKSRFDRAPSSYHSNQNEEERDLSAIGRNVTATEAAAEK